MTFPKKEIPDELRSWIPRRNSIFAPTTVRILIEDCYRAGFEHGREAAGDPAAAWREKYAGRAAERRRINA